MEYLEKEDCKVDKLTFANEIQFNIKEEASAIENYNRLLKMLEDVELPQRQKEVIQSVIFEINGDELNHQTKLKELFTLVSGIKEAQD